MVGAESFQIIWVIGVRPNLITWVVVFFFFFFFVALHPMSTAMVIAGRSWVVGVSLFDQI